MNNSKRNKLLKAINDIQNNFTSHVSASSSSSASSSVYVSSTNPELAQHFTFPVDRIHAILSKEIFLQKLDLFITIYLVNILEYICKDILRLTLYYVRMLGKYNINKSDVTTAIQADPILPQVFFPDSLLPADKPHPPSDETHFAPANFEFNNLDDDVEDELLLGNNSEFLASSREKARHPNDFDASAGETFTSDEALLFSPTSLRTCTSSALNIKLTNLKREITGSSSSNSNNNNNGSNSSNNEDVASDSSTICAESVSVEQLNQKYQAKVRELVAEQKQYLDDLNVLRRVFMFLFKRCCYLFSIRLDEAGAVNGEEGQEQVIDNIFGNVNDLYDCALRLADLLEDATILNNNNSPSLSSSMSDLQTTGASSRPGITPIATGCCSTPQLMVGQQFWELAEGDEFSIYTKYAETVTNFGQVRLFILITLWQEL